jgi:hypothetical protein
MAFWEDMAEEYGDYLSAKRYPFDLNCITVAVRRKDIAEKIVEICIRNELSLNQALNMLSNLKSLHLSSGLTTLSEYLYPAEGGTQR